MRVLERKLNIPEKPESIVLDLQSAGFETYIVGGAVRDLLLGTEPKDFDISTSATPEEIREFFGRKRARIIGKRFRLVHLHTKGELFEVSTFRQNPNPQSDETDQDSGNSAMILSDNNFGSAEDDAWRRDFTVNALFYNPENHTIIDYTGNGIDDINSGVVRAIGDPDVRFAEDPVRLLRALKLVAQYNFSLSATTENALFRKIDLLQSASISRLSLEFEKILQSGCCEKYLQTFHDYGMLKFFLPTLDSLWGSPYIEEMLDLLDERSERIYRKLYRNSVSLVLAICAIPVLKQEIKCEPGVIWDSRLASMPIIQNAVEQAVRPLTPVQRIKESAFHILKQLPSLTILDDKNKAFQMSKHSYTHARELLMIYASQFLENYSTLADYWPGFKPSRPKHRRKPGKHHS